MVFTPTQPVDARYVALRNFIFLPHISPKRFLMDRLDVLDIEGPHGYIMGLLLPCLCAVVHS